MDNMLSDINRAIAQRTNYGYRRELAHRSGWVINWSNREAYWYVDTRVNKGALIVLDANQVFVPATKKEILKLIDKLDQLPLYKNSFEYISMH